jgi:broad specificity phosphatase PhoE
LTPSAADCYGHAPVPTRVYLVRHGVTAWHRDGRMLGQRDIPLDPEGVAQAEIAAAALGAAGIGEIVSSPLVRSVQTAEILGRRAAIDVARDPRLTDLRIGSWEGQRASEVMASPDYQRFTDAPESERPPGGESLPELVKRTTAAIEQILADNPAGEAVAVVTHAADIRVLVLHYLGAPLTGYHRLRIAPGSISLLSFTGTRPSVLAVDWTADLARMNQA